MKKKGIVIGGGAAGMMAAVAAAQRGAQILLLDKNEKLGKKIYITGKGRCNVTFSSMEDSFFTNVIRNPKFLYSAFAALDNRGVMEMLEEAGCPLKTERGDRVFPVSDHASDVIAAFQRLLKKYQVEIRLQTLVKEILFDSEDGHVLGVLLQNGERLLCDFVILATGGASYPSTGSTGDGYEFARKQGLTVKDIIPALVPMNIRETWCKEAMGVALKNVGLTMKMGKKTLYDGFGEMLFTHFGISGPLVLSASSYIPEKIKDEIKLFIDLKPALSLEQLDQRLIREFTEANNKQFKNSINNLFPAKLIPIMISLSGISPYKKCNEISKEERSSFAKLIKELSLTLDSLRGMDEAIITRGGISVKEVNPSSMEVKNNRGWYLAGEVLDLDALTGGFNLQIAWSTGYLAGKSAAEA